MSQRYRQAANTNIPKKANKLLNLILLAFMLIILRIWHLTVVQHEERQENALKPQRRTIVESSKRGTIRDRFNLPLAINRMQYNAAILYSPLKQIPSVRWEKTEDGKKNKLFPRKDYVTKLAKLFAEKLSMDPEQVEDLIHSKGALYNQIPFVIKEDLSEKEYYTLRALEKDWPGIQTQKIPRRYYPQGKVGCDIIGYLGAINRNEYDAIIEEMRALQNYISSSELDEELPLPQGYSSFQQVKFRLKELKAKSYTLTDRVGKAGIEARYERDLRGASGKKNYRSDAHGNLLKEFPGGHCPLSGKRVILTISAELQAYAEELLIQNEQIRETRATRLSDQKRYLASKKPWIKGGAVVVLEPNSGEILALASHPRYDPNDFILSGDQETNRKKRSNIMRWLESEEHIAELWDQKRPIERELYDVKNFSIFEEQKMLSWHEYLSIILAHKSPLLPILRELSVTKAIEFISNSDTPLLSGFSTSDKELCLDLCRVAVDETRFNEALRHDLSDHSLSSYRQNTTAFLKIQETVQEVSKGLFHDHDFAAWRKKNEKSFLSQKRQEEKAEKRYAKPYIDLLNAQETSLFKDFWESAKWQLIERFLLGKLSSENTNGDSETPLDFYLDYFQNWHEEIVQGAHKQTSWYAAYVELEAFLRTMFASQRIPYLQTFRSYFELNRPLKGKYPQLRNYNGMNGIQLEKDLAAAFYPRYGHGYGRSQAYRQSAPQGSIFKLIVAYEALIQKFQTFKNAFNITPLQLNPLEITDCIYTIGKESFVGYLDNGKPIPRFYKGGRIPRSTSKNLGKMNLLKAIETSSNPYFSLLAGEILNSPNDLAKVARLFGYGERTGIDLPGEIPGKIPDDLETNRTGLYAMAIGQHSLVVTPLQAGVMLSTLANGGKILKPKIVKAMVEKTLTPPYILTKPPTIEKRCIDIPPIIRETLLTGMHRVVLRSQAESLQPLSRLYHNHPEAIKNYIELKHQLLGKTSTAEVIERIDLDLKNGVNMYNHVWFGGISYLNSNDSNNETTLIAKDLFGMPEVVVIVYLRFGGFGKESAPIAAQLVAKWREIKQKQLQN